MGFIVVLGLVLLPGQVFTSIPQGGTQAQNRSLKPFQVRRSGAGILACLRFSATCGGRTGRNACATGLSERYWTHASSLLEKQESEEELRARLASEPDLIRKARLAVRLAEVELETATKRYGESEWEKGAASVKQMLDHVEEAYKHLKDTGRDPRRNPKGFKETEIQLRTLLRRLEDLRATLPVDERALLDHAIARIQEIRQALLDGLLHVKEKKEKK